MRILNILMCLVLVALLAGCATTGEGAFYERQREDEAAHAVRMSALADATACNGDATCVVATKAIAGLTEAAGGGGRGPQQYVPQPSTAARIGLALIGQISPLASAAVAWRSSDNSVRSAEAQFGFLGGVVDSVSNASSRSAEAAFGVLPQLGPRIDVGGDYVSGTQTIVGRDQIEGGQHVGDWRTGDDVRRDQIGGDRTDYGNGNRLNSPGPYRDTGNTGPRCTGIGCQTTNPLPEPDAEGE